MPDAQGGGIAERGGGEVRAVDADDGQVGIRVFPNKLGGEPPAVRQGGLDLAGAMDDVAVGEDEAVGGEDESRPAAAGVGPALGGVVDLDIDHRRAGQAGGFHHSAGIGVKSGLLRGRIVPGFGC